MNYCTKCGAKLEEDSNFCVNCGSKIEREEVKEQGILSKENNDIKIETSNEDKEIVLIEGTCNRIISKMNVQNGYGTLTDKRFIYSKHSLGKTLALGVFTTLTEAEYEFDIPIEKIKEIKDGKQGISKTIVIVTDSEEEYNFYFSKREDWIREFNRILGKEFTEENRQEVRKNYQEPKYYSGNKKNNPVAIASMVIGIISIFVNTPIPSIVAIVLAAVAYNQIDKNDKKQKTLIIIGGVTGILSFLYISFNKIILELFGGFM